MMRSAKQKKTSAISSAKRPRISGTFFIIGICALVYLFIVISKAEWPKYLSFLGSHPFWLFGIPWTSSLFIHFRLPHLFWNMFIFFLCAPRLEQRLGKWGLVLLFLWGGMIGHLLSLWLVPISFYAYGASGGVCAVVILYLLLYPKITLRGGEDKYETDKQDGIPSYLLIFYVVGTDILGVLIDPSFSSGISFYGHLGGSAVGLIVWGLYDFENPISRSLFNKMYRSLPMLLVLFAVIIGIRGMKTIYSTPDIPRSLTSLGGTSQNSQIQLLKHFLYHPHERHLKMIVNTLFIPPKYRTPDQIQAYTLEEVEALAPQMGISKDHPRFQFFLDLYKNAPYISPERRGYSFKKTQ